ncbi:hypothetical protein HK101_000626 [Irineochytrium annulatum]|nr:hypothetical protein HK101_000626 [Irineochytrium annulatum]
MLSSPVRLDGSAPIVCLCLVVALGSFVYSWSFSAAPAANAKKAKEQEQEEKSNSRWADAESDALLAESVAILGTCQKSQVSNVWGYLHARLRRTIRGHAILGGRRFKQCTSRLRYMKKKYKAVHEIVAAQGRAVLFDSCANHKISVAQYEILHQIYGDAHADVVVRGISDDLNAAPSEPEDNDDSDSELTLINPGDTHTINHIPDLLQQVASHERRLQRLEERMYGGAFGQTAGEVADF